MQTLNQIANYVGFACMLSAAVMGLWCMLCIFIPRKTVIDDPSENFYNNN